MPGWTPERCWLKRGRWCRWGGHGAAIRQLWYRRAQGHAWRQLAEVPCAWFARPALTSARKPNPCWPTTAVPRRSCNVLQIHVHRRVCAALQALNGAQLRYDSLLGRPADSHGVYFGSGLAGGGAVVAAARCVLLRNIGAWMRASMHACQFGCKGRAPMPPVADMQVPVRGRPLGRPPRCRSAPATLQRRLPGDPGCKSKLEPSRCRQHSPEITATLLRPSAAAALVPKGTAAAPGTRNPRAPRRTPRRQRQPGSLPRHGMTRAREAMLPPSPPRSRWAQPAARCGRQPCQLGGPACRRAPLRAAVSRCRTRTGLGRRRAEELASALPARRFTPRPRPVVQCGTRGAGNLTARPRPTSSWAPPPTGTTRSAGCGSRTCSLHSAGPGRRLPRLGAPLQPPAGVRLRPAQPQAAPSGHGGCRCRTQGLLPPPPVPPLARPALAP